MKYFRHEIDPGSFSAFMPEGAKMYMRPEMPKIEFKEGKLKCRVTDLRLLNPLGCEAFERLLVAMVTAPETGEAKMFASADVDEDTLSIIADIVTGFSYEVKRGGKNGWSMDGSLAYSYSQTETENGGTEIVFTFNTETAQYMQDYAREHNNTLNLFEMIPYIAERQHEDFLERKEKGDVLL